MLQVERDVGGQLGWGQLGQQGLGGGQRQLGVNGVVFTRRVLGPHPDAGGFGHKNQFIGLQSAGHRGGDFFHGEVEGLARGRKTKGREQHHRPRVQSLGDALHVDFAHHARMLEVHPVDHAYRSGGDEVARHHPHRGTGHGGVGQALAERRLDFVAQLASGLLGAVQRHAVGDAQAIYIMG